MDFYFNDLYPNQGFYNTRTQTIPEADDKQALAEDEKASLNAKISPKQKFNVWTAFIVIIAVVIMLGVLK